MTAPSPSAPTSGFVYADVPNRVIAIIIDGIVIFVIMILVGIVLATIGLAASTITGGAGGGFVGSLVLAVVSLVIGAGYFIYTWTSMRGTVGMKALGMQIGNAADGQTITTDQAIRRYLALAAPGIVANALSGVPVIGALLGLVSFGWIIYLLYTTAQSPTKQGFHDVFANTMVVKSARTVV